MKRTAASMQAVLVLMLCHSANAIAEEPERIAPPQPAFREMLKGEDYQSQFKAVRSTLGSLQDLEALTMPVLGLEISNILAEGQLEKLGLKVGDIVFQLGQRPTYAHFRVESRVTQQLHYWAAALNTRRTVRVRPGTLGFQTIPHWRPDLAWLKEGPRDPRWDETVLVATAACVTRPELSETAWFHALKAGYPADVFTAACGAMLSLNQGRPEVAAAFAACLPQDELDAAKLVPPQLLYRVALANHQLERMRDLASLYPGVFRTDSGVMQYLIDLAAAERKEQKLTASPSQLAETMYADDLLPRATGRFAYSNDVWLPQLQRKEAVVTDVQANYRSLNAFGLPEPVANLDMRIQLTAKPRGTERTQYQKMLGLAFLSEDTGEPNDLGVLGNAFLRLCIKENHWVEIGHSALPTSFEYHDPNILVDGETVHKVRFVRVGGQAEILLDGKRLALIAVPPAPTRMKFAAQVSGMTVEFKSWTVHELLERP